MSDIEKSRDFKLKYMFRPEEETPILATDLREARKRAENYIPRNASILGAHKYKTEIDQSKFNR